MVDPNDDTPALEFDLESVREILSRTPRVLEAWLADLPGPYIHQNEGEGTWSPFDIVGHLIHGERTDWIPRARTILEHGPSRVFEPFDRFAQFENSRGKSLSELLDEFAVLRARNLLEIDALGIGTEHLKLAGQHPAFGAVTLRELLSTWVVHDLGHLAQVARVMARGYQAEVGPWKAYLPVLTR